jgi:hypothetical protein
MAQVKKRKNKSMYNQDAAEQELNVRQGRGVMLRGRG